jgi:branched-subunit amino acid transport protein AzlD
MTTGELIVFFAVMGIATFLTRAAPFLLLKSHKDSRWLLHFGRVLPLMILVVLVGFSGVGLIDEQANRHALIAIAMVITALVHRLFLLAMVSVQVGGVGSVVGSDGRRWA